jgi:hypothetical protein
VISLIIRDTTQKEKDALWTKNFIDHRTPETTAPSPSEIAVNICKTRPQNMRNHGIYMVVELTTAC